VAQVVYVRASTGSSLEGQCKRGNGMAGHLLRTQPLKSQRNHLKSKYARSTKHYIEQDHIKIHQRMK